MKVLKLYLETTVWNFLATEKESSVREATTKLFEEIQEKGHRIYISPLVIVEIDRTKDRKRQVSLRELIKEHKPELLEDMPQVRSLAEKYLLAKIMPQKYEADAMHIAFATFYEMDALISWNLRHIVKMRTRRLVNYINMMEGYRSLELVTPEEVIEYEEG